MEDPALRWNGDDPDADERGLLCVDARAGGRSLIGRPHPADVESAFLDLADDKLKEAHAYAYGGSLVQDMGYYPFGNRCFSDLAHYVRSGDFVTCLFQEATTPNEYAFALGALAHYASDNSGHPMVNHIVPMEFPDLGKKYGSEVTYADSPKAHIRAEFGSDMTQVAKSHYTSDRFHDLVGYEISQGLLERVFPKVYGIDFDDVVHDEDLAIGTFRHAVSKVIPEMTRVALLARKNLCRTLSILPTKNISTISPEQSTRGNGERNTGIPDSARVYWRSS